jgi:hypothetical protein
LFRSSRTTAETRTRSTAPIGFFGNAGSREERAASLALPTAAPPAAANSATRAATIHTDRICLTTVFLPTTVDDGTRRGEIHRELRLLLTLVTVTGTSAKDFAVEKIRFSRRPTALEVVAHLKFSIDTSVTDNYVAKELPRARRRARQSEGGQPREYDTAMTARRVRLELA